MSVQKDYPVVIRSVVILLEAITVLAILDLKFCMITTPCQGQLKKPSKYNEIINFFIRYK